MDKPSTSRLSIYCCNPFKKPGHFNYKKNVRPVSKHLLQETTLLNLGDKICDTCRKAIYVQPSAAEGQSLVSVESSGLATGNSDSSESDEVFEKNEALVSLNTSLQCVGESPIKRKRLLEKKYAKTKLIKAAEAIGSKILGVPPEKTIHSGPGQDEIVNQLKEKFISTDSKSLKMQILTTLPRSWTPKTIQREFGVSNFMARKAKQLQKVKGIMSSPDPKPGKVLDIKTVQRIKDFYEDEIS